MEWLVYKMKTKSPIFDSLSVTSSYSPSFLSLAPRPYPKLDDNMSQPTMGALYYSSACDLHGLLGQSLTLLHLAL